MRSGSRSIPLSALVLTMLLVWFGLPPAATFAREEPPVENMRDLFTYDGLLQAIIGRVFEDGHPVIRQVPPFPVEQNYPETIAGRAMRTYVDWIAPTFLLSLAGLPVASVPAGLDPSGLPAGLQIVARPRGEEAALALAAVIQAANPTGLPDAERIAGSRVEVQPRDIRRVRGTAV